MRTSNSYSHALPVNLEVIWGSSDLLYAPLKIHVFKNYTSKYLRVITDTLRRNRKGREIQSLQAIHCCRGGHFSDRERFTNLLNPSSTRMAVVPRRVRGSGTTKLTNSFSRGVATGEIECKPTAVFWAVLDRWQKSQLRTFDNKSARILGHQKFLATLRNVLYARRWP
jgi:hypothetical protein